MNNHKNIESTTRFRTTKSIALKLLACYLFFGGSEAYVSTNYAKTTNSVAKDDVSSAIAADTTKLGNLEVPNVGVGTISWSSDKCKSKGRLCWDHYHYHHSPLTFWPIFMF